MQARTLTPAMIFGNQVRYVVPLFQRPYVWTEQDQWAPLWDDVHRIAEQLLAGPAGYGLQQPPVHFLGAIVLDQPLTPTGYIGVRHVVDGQQRLTTLQLMLDAAEWVASRHGAAIDAQALRVLVLNESAITPHPHEVYKVWPTDRDQAAFLAAMDNSTEVPSELKYSAVARAHQFFTGAIEKWAIISDDPAQTTARIRALALTLREHLKMVVIDLEPGDNAQVIFETLNHRGAPLLAADLIKNLVFQTAAIQGLDTAELYNRYWRELDSDYWRQKVARGRQYIPRIDIFVNYWLVMHLRHEVPADRIFVEFRDHLMAGQSAIEPTLAELAQDAAIYRTLDSHAASSAIGRFHYRTIQALDSAVVTPFLLALLRQPTGALSVAQRDKALAALESWLIRRAVCRLTSKDINRLVIDLLQKLAEADPASAGDATEAFLLAQTADSRVWPTDSMVLEALASMPAYKVLLRGRLRMLLEAIEDHRRTGKSEQAGCPRGLTIEHVMPQAWREHWVPDLDADIDPAKRDQLLHTLGNLTLVNNKLNPAMSNRPWTDASAQSRGLGGSGKRSELLHHSTLKINADLVELAPEGWHDAAIQQRTKALATVITEIWHRPGQDLASAVTLADAELETLPTTELADIEQSPSTRISKYEPITEWLKAQTADALPLSFTELEDILGQLLPPSARQHAPYWYDHQNSLGKAIKAAGYRPQGADLTAEQVTLVRD
ncbi:MAG: DUF262 domain-containing protein [Hamadaea sp.]|uniref:DUF262 domain-containing protein n=1 Tax=Hamadaea sp. TaxID=2024425 RepID=UPI001797496A|nr:DUF262 domain-containing HNH endonuclease family protein [Hamadaea sp.]NUT18003.1 DUF262 domain-containing protein [Hamadaea sp.]